MKKSFYKYEGAGNDFILFDNFQHALQLNTGQVKKLCDRHFGIGADGLILLQPQENLGFEMVYFNADGNIGSMCGNGARCAVHLAKQLSHIGKEAVFLTFDGIHKAEMINDERIKVSMSNINSVKKIANDLLIDSGSPHYVRFVSSLDLDVVQEGKKVRFSHPFKEQGVNVNFVSLTNDEISMRTYERGVENETLSCGTGTVAAAIAVSLKENSSQPFREIQAPGGKLKVYFSRQNDGTFSDIWLEGPVKMVFTGEIVL